MLIHHKTDEANKLNQPACVAQTTQCYSDFAVLPTSTLNLHNVTCSPAIINQLKNDFQINGLVH